MNCSSDDSSPQKRKKLNSVQKHRYPIIAPSSDDELSNDSNLKFLKEEWDSPKNGDPSKVKSLFIHTRTSRRMAVLCEESNPTAYSILQEYKMLKKSSYVSAELQAVYIVLLYGYLLYGYFYALQAKLEFELTMQRQELKNEFDEELVLWSKAIVTYCRKTIKKSTSIQKLVKDVDVNCKLSK